ncbi:hypothetical protein JCM9279_003813 [Rhodotorula babjevae]
MHMLHRRHLLEHGLLDSIASKAVQEPLRQQHRSYARLPDTPEPIRDDRAGDQLKISTHKFSAGQPSRPCRLDLVQPILLPSWLSHPLAFIRALFHLWFSMRIAHITTGFASGILNAAVWVLFGRTLPTTPSSLDKFAPVDLCDQLSDFTTRLACGIGAVYLLGDDALSPRTRYGSSAEMWARGVRDFVFGKDRPWHQCLVFLAVVYVMRARFLRYARRAVMSAAGMLFLIDE